MSPLAYSACPLCATSAGKEYCTAPDRFALTEAHTYSLQQCSQCGMIYLNPRPREEDSGHYYQNAAYLPFSSTTNATSFTEKIYAALRRVNLRWKKNLLRRFHHTGALLDVGCGTGEFLAFMRAAGWRVQGLERDANAAEWGRKHWQLQIHTGSVEDLQQSNESFDVITLWHVLEHVYAPRAALRLLSQRLRDGGVLIIAVPNIGSVDARVYREHWIALDVPRHVNHFTLNTLKRCAEENALRLMRWQQLPLDAFFNTLMSERLQAEHQHASPALMPLRWLRAGVVTCASLYAGSRLPFASAQSGATLVAIFQK